MFVFFFPSLYLCEFVHIGVQIWLLFFNFPYQFSEHSFAHINWRSINAPSLRFCHSLQRSSPGPGFRSASGCPGETELGATSGIWSRCPHRPAQALRHWPSNGVHTPSWTAAPGSLGQHDCGSFCGIFSRPCFWTWVLLLTSPVFGIYWEENFPLPLASKGLGPTI